MKYEADALRRLPSVDEVLKAQAAIAAINRFGRPSTVAAVRAALDAARAALKAGQADGAEADTIAAAV